MSTQSLSSVAIDVVGQYRLAAEHLARAYQAGVRRSASAIGERFAAAVQSRELPLVDDSVKSSLIGAQQHVSGIVVGALTAGSAAVAALNERLAEGAKNGIERAADGFARVEAVLDTRTADTVKALGLPSAQLSLAVASAVADGAKRLGDRLGDADGVADAVEVSPSPVKRARRAVRRA